MGEVRKIFFKGKCKIAANIETVLEWSKDEFDEILAEYGHLKDFFTSNYNLLSEMINEQSCKGELSISQIGVGKQSVEDISIESLGVMYIFDDLKQGERFKLLPDNGKSVFVKTEEKCDKYGRVTINAVAVEGRNVGCLYCFDFNRNVEKVK